MKTARVFLGEVANASEFESRLIQAFEWVQLGEILKPGTRVFIKPNLISRMYAPGVTTSPDLVRALVRILKDWTDQLYVCESGGWLNRWTAHEAMIGHGIDVLAREFGVKLLDLDTVPHKPVKCDVRGRDIWIELPVVLLDECDVLVTVPVVKTHIITTVSLGMKNLYGCIPHPHRLLYHPRVDEVIVGLTKILRPQLVVMDGLYAMNGPGPTYGDVIPFNFMLVSDNAPVGDYVCCQVMNMNPAHVGHLALASHEGLISRSSDIAFNDMPQRFAHVDFRMTRGLRSWAAYIFSKSTLMTRLVYLSPLSILKDQVVKIIRK